MTTLIDTNIAIHLRDGEAGVIARLGALRELPQISVITRIELEGGIVTGPPEIARRRRTMLATLLSEFDILYFDADAALAYSRLIAVTGYSRSRVLDRMIAATALAHGLSLITMNGRHFRDVPGLDLIEWPSPPMR